jgi:phosphoribosylanthranilate isomerase
MPRTRIKICGVNTVEAALAAAAAGADAIGLVFVQRSPRHVEVDVAMKIAAALPAFVEPVGLFADLPVEKVRDIAQITGLKTLQLHGREGPAYITQLRQYRVIKAVGFDPDRLSDRVGPWRKVRGNLIGLLLDSPPATDDGLGGGSGQTFDWQRLAELKATGALDNLPPLALAGGLTPDNVADAVRTVRPYAVDVSSGVEAHRGVKDLQRIATFCDAVRQADAS